MPLSLALAARLASSSTPYSVVFEPPVRAWSAAPVPQHGSSAEVGRGGGGPHRTERMGGGGWVLRERQVEPATWGLAQRGGGSIRVSAWRRFSFLRSFQLLARRSKITHNLAKWPAYGLFFRGGFKSGGRPQGYAISFAVEGNSSR